MASSPYARQSSTIPPFGKAGYGHRCRRNEQGPTIRNAEADLSSSRLAGETEMNEYAIVIEDAGANLPPTCLTCPGALAQLTTSKRSKC